MRLDVNIDDNIKFTNKLERMGKYDFPVVVRQTLNNAAFKSRKRIVEKEIYNRFTIRKSKPFFRKHIQFQKAKGNRVDGMMSSVGLVAQSSIAARRLEKQELGGSLKRPFIYHDQARVSKSDSKRVRKANYLSDLGMVKGKSSGKSKKSNMVANAVMASRTGKLMKVKSRSGGKSSHTVFSVRSVNTSRGRVKFRMTPIASYKAGRNVKIDKRPFISPAAIKESKNMNKYYAQNAEKRFKKALTL